LALALLPLSVDGAVIQAGDPISGADAAMASLESLPSAASPFGADGRVPAFDPAWGSVTGLVDFAATDRLLQLIDASLAGRMSAVELSPLDFVLRSPEMAAIAEAVRYVLL
jgi:hypothetical protein